MAAERKDNAHRYVARHVPRPTRVIGLPAGVLADALAELAAWDAMRAQGRRTRGGKRSITVTTGRAK